MEIHPEAGGDLLGSRLHYACELPPSAPGVPVNVQSDIGSNVAFSVVDPLASHPQLASLPAQVSSFSTVAGVAVEDRKQPNEGCRHIEQMLPLQASIKRSSQTYPCLSSLLAATW
jgi:hypothetical protein